MARSEPEHPPLWGTSVPPSAEPNSVTRPSHFARWGILWGSLVLLIFGTGPLGFFMLLDPAANPVGPGILAMFTFWPAVLGVLLGLVYGIVRTWLIKR